jgi:hypothetical protein
MPLFVEAGPNLSPDKLSQLADRLSPRALGAGEPYERQSTKLIGPFPTYWISAMDLVWGTLESAKQQGWRGLVLAGDNPVVTADFTESDSINLGSERIADELATSLKVAKDLNNEPNRIAVRILSIPDVYITSLWLSGSPNGDYFVPINSLSKNLSNRRLCSLSEIVKEVRDALPPQSGGTQLGKRRPEPGMPGSKSGLPD